MKKIILLITALSFAMTICGTATSMAQLPPTPPTPPNPYNNTIGTIIIFYPQPKPSKPRPRSISFAPITATYDASSLSINLSFMEDLGDLTLTVINNSTGEQWFEYTNASTGAAQIYISGNEGQYTILIEPQTGDSYYGEFLL